MTLLAGFPKNDLFLGKTRQSDFPEYAPLVCSNYEYTDLNGDDGPWHGQDNDVYIHVY